jgi:hypothetical protein
VTVSLLALLVRKAQYPICLHWKTNLDDVEGDGEDDETQDEEIS